MVTTAKTTYFQGQTSPMAGKPLFCQFLCAIVHYVFWLLRLPVSFLSKVYTNVRLELIYGVGWSQHPKRAISMSNEPQTW